MEDFDYPYGKEDVRMAILKHEETFKEQVYELHRLYRIQKIMMRNMACKKPNAQSHELESSKNDFSFNPTNHAYNLHQNSTTNLDLERPGVQNVADSNSNKSVAVYTDENEIELTLGPKNYNRRNKPETSITSDSTQGLSSSSTGSSHLDRISSMNHQKTNKRREELTSNHNFGFVQVSDVTLGYQSGSKKSIVLEEQLRQERLKQPPRLFQVLSLNTT